jgi:hypothetical protein
MKKRSYEDWIDLHWQRELSPEEVQDWQSFLSNQPDFAAQWELDQQLLQGVRSLDDIPLSNNFTSRVLRSVAHVQTERVDQFQTQESATESWLSRLWALPGIRVAGVSILILVGVGMWQWDPNAVNLVESVTTITEAETVPTVEELQDFDAIHGLAQSSADIDWELVLAMD